MDYTYTPPPPDPIEYRVVSKVLKKEVGVHNKQIKQFDIPAYYRANVRNKDKPIFSQHGLQNYNVVKLGDNRLHLEKSFSHEVFHREIPRPDPDKGLSEEHIMANRRRDYSYVKSINGGSVDKVCGEVLEAIKLKLKIRTKIGLYELIETFKHFVQEGKEDITIAQMRMVFEMMGFSFSEYQVLSLFAKYDEKCKGELSYKDFIRLLKSETDFCDVHRPWLLQKGQTLTVPQSLRCQVDPEEDQRRLEEKRFEFVELYRFLDKQGQGYLDDAQLGVLLTIVGSDLNGPGLQSHIKVLKDRAVNNKVDFDTFWTWWLTQVV